jgi:RNA polymerase sigma-70 factor (ECF subfamily)
MPTDRQPLRLSETAPDEAADSRAEGLDAALARALLAVRAGTGGDAVADAADRLLRPRLLRYFRAHGIAVDDAEDLVQKTLARVFQGIRGLRHEDRLLPWLFAVARNVRRSAQSRERMAPVSRDAAEPWTGDDPPFELDSTPSPEALALAEERLRRARAAIAALPAQQRQCLVLRAAQEMSYREIADTLRLSVHTVRNHIAQARKELRRKLAAFDPKESSP